MNEVLNNGTNAFTTDDSFCRSFALIDCFLTKHTKNVLCDREFNYQLICIKFTRWKTLYAHVSFYLAVELFAFTVSMVMKLYNKT